MQTRILVINGPNLSRLGRRKTVVYGTFTLEDVQRELETLAGARNAQVELFASEHEGEIVARIHQAVDDGVDAIIVNAAAYTHTSIAIRDALHDAEIPFIECHISNVHAREPFRHHSYLSDIAVGVICGLGMDSYRLALTALLNRIDDAR